MSETTREAPRKPVPVPAPAKEVVTEARYTISEYWLNGKHGAMRYWKSEPSHGLPIVFVHGYGALIEHWRRIMRPIAREQTFTALDLYGFGYSTYPRVTPSKELWAGQVAELITTVLHQPAVVVGHSVGGMVAAQTARDYPELVRALVMVNSTGLPDNRENTMSPMDMLFFEMVRAPILGELLAGAYGTPWGARQGLMQAYYRKDRVTAELVEAFSGPLRRPGAGSYYLSVSRALDKVFLDIEPDQLSMPKLLLWGTEDDSMPATQAARFKRELFPDAEIIFLSESGHCPFDEQPEPFCDALLSWIDRTLVV